jgi:CRISPR/Cas system CMR subunit Cmr4 (Cas7 group RAMP superfamily)
MRPDRVQITYDLKFLAPFHFGTGIRASLVDRTVVRDGDGYLYVPGSTIKGVLRERCEQLVRLYARDKQRLTSPHDEKAALADLGKQPPTLITRVFGSHTAPSRLYFDDASLDEQDKPRYDHSDPRIQSKYREMQVNLYTQARLDRLTRTAVPGALYTSEFGMNESVFKGSIQGWLSCTAIDTSEQAPTYSLLLLLAGMRMLDRLGGNKSTGKGQCTCDITSVTLNDRSVPSEVWLAWLRQIGRLADYDREGKEK